MIKINIIALGSLKEKYLRDASAEYEKRLKGYCTLNIIEIEPIRLSAKPSDSEITSVLEREAELIVKKIPENNAVFALCIEGNMISSRELAETIEAEKNLGRNITFIIGSSYGLAERIKHLSAKKLSFSRLTFPHQLFRVMLLEQIYRSFKITAGGTYHK